MLQRFSTRHIAPNKQTEAAEEFFTVYTKTLVAPINKNPIVVESTLRLLPDFAISKNWNTPCSLSHPPQGDELLIHIAVDECVETRPKGGDSALCRQGDAYITSNEVPQSTIFRSDCTSLTIVIPRTVLKPVVPNINKSLMKKIPIHANREWKIFVDFAQTLLRDIGPLSPELARESSTNVQDLAILALGASGEAAEIAQGRGLRVARLQAMKTDIFSRLSDPNLSLDTIARSQNLSPRYIRALLENEDTNFSAFVLEARLRQSYRLLLSPHFRDQPVIQIALSAGFNDISWFNQAFRRRFGCTPTELRREGAALAWKKN